MDHIFSLLADKHTRNILRQAYAGLKTSSNYNGNMSKKQLYLRLRRLKKAGLIKKTASSYSTTTLGSVVYNNHVKTMEGILVNDGVLRWIDVFKTDKEMPLPQRESIVNELLRNSNLHEIVNSTHLTGFAIIKDFKHLILEVLKLLDNATEEVFFASRYYDEHVSAKILELHSRGVKVHLMDGNMEGTSLESRLNAVLRTPQNREAHEKVLSIVRSPRFDLKKCNVPLSFVVVDGRQVGYEVVSHSNPQEFTVGIACYDDPYLAKTFCRHFELLSEKAETPRLLASIPNT
jgi:DNA-binding HxlR family transcriptional regulator